jgi:glyoxylase-like metal-dependent hydrolase (beta-lactamase superfamily II)
MTRERQLELDALIEKRTPLLHEAAPNIAHPQIRNRGTIGGSIVNADPAAELPVLMLALDARLKAQNSSGERWIEAKDFFIGIGGNAPGNSGLGLATSRVLAHEQVLRRMSAPSGQPSPRPFAAWPTETFFGGDKEIFFNDEAIQLLHQPGHTDGDILVFFRRSDVVASGDGFMTSTYPVIDVEKGGTVQGVIDGMNRLLDLTIPRDKAEGGTYVVPGHGRLSDEADVDEYRDMLTIIRDRIQDLVDKGRTLAEVQAARPTRDYDGRYGATAGAGTTDRFVEIVYRELDRARR